MTNITDVNTVEKYLRNFATFFLNKLPKPKSCPNIKCRVRKNILIDIGIFDIFIINCSLKDSLAFAPASILVYLEWQCNAVY